MTPSLFERILLCHEYTNGVFNVVYFQVLFHFYESQKIYYTTTNFFFKSF